MSQRSSNNDGTHIHKSHVLSYPILPHDIIPYDNTSYLSIWYQTIWYDIVSCDMLPSCYFRALSFLPVSFVVAFLASFISHFEVGSKVGKRINRHMNLIKYQMIWYDMNLNVRLFDVHTRGIRGETGVNQGASRGIESISSYRSVKTEIARGDRCMLWPLLQN